MKITVVGAGAIGGFLGARLSAAGEEVTFIARNHNLQAINANGFRLIEENGSELHAKGVRAVQRYLDAGPQDVVLLTVKAHQVRDLLPDLRGLFGPETMVVSMIIITITTMTRQIIMMVMLTMMMVLARMTARLGMRMKMWM